MKITVIGAGNIGGATALGLWSAGFEHITVTARHATTLEKFASRGISTSLDNIAASQDADIIILAVKPWLMEGVVKEVVRPHTSQVIVSMAPGVPSAEILGWAGADIPLAYVIPNTAIELGQSMTFIAPVTTDEEQTQMLSDMFAKVGSVMTVPESRLGAGTALASCGIAYALRYIRASAEGGVQLGMFAADATKVVAQTVKGAAALLEAHGLHPEQEIDKVTTPGGMTIRGLNAMEEAGFTNAVIKGLEACQK